MSLQVTTQPVCQSNVETRKQAFWAKDLPNNLIIRNGKIRVKATGKLAKFGPEWEGVEIVIQRHTYAKIIHELADEMWKQKQANTSAEMELQVMA